MSSRHMARLKAQAELAAARRAEAETAAEDEGSDEEEEEEEEEGPAAAPFNPFDLLGSEEENTSDVWGSEDDEAGESMSEPEPAKNPAASGGAGADEDAEPARPPTASGDPDEGPDGESAQSSKKKKKKKKKKRGGGAKQCAKAGTQPAEKAREESDDELDRIMSELGIQAPSTATPSQGETPKDARPFLRIEPRFLRADEELKRMFGARVVAETEREAQAEERRRYGRAGYAPRGGARRGLKPGMLVQPRENWPPMTNGMAMEFEGTDEEGRQVFRYVHPPGYNALQRAFEQCQASHDPNSIAHLLHTAPYHVDALLAMHDLHRATGDHAYAEEMMSRALYALEAAWHPRFVPDALRQVRLDYEVEENRALFVAMFRHIQALGRRGCHRTALECCKLLLAINDDDPMGALFAVDYFALRAKSPSVLLELVDRWPGTDLSTLPNFAYSCALARHQLDGTASGLSAHDALVQALLTFPMVMVALVEKLGSLGVNCRPYEALLARAPFKGSANGGDNASLAHLVDIYVTRSHVLWKATTVQPFLLKAAAEACDIADGFGTCAGGLGAADIACVREAAFPPGEEVNEYRFLRVGDFSDDVSALPMEELRAAMAQRGPPGVPAGVPAGVPPELANLPPDALQDVLQAAAAAAAEGRPIPEDELAGQHPVMMLLRSMLPWVNAGVAPAYDEEDGAREPPSREGQGGDAEDD